MQMESYWRERFGGSGRYFIWTYLLIVVCFSTQIILPAFNVDDIAQAQMSQPDDFIAQGRWAYGLVFAYLHGYNFGGPFFLLVGLFILASAGWVGAASVGIRRPLAIALFAAIASVSFYYQLLFSFDSTRIAYPLATFFGSLAALFAVEKRRILSVLALCLAPAFYTAGATIFLALVSAQLLLSLAEGKDFKSWLLDLLERVLIFIAGMALNLAIAKICIELTNNWTSERSVTPSLETLLGTAKMYMDFSVPIYRGSWDYYYTAPSRILETIILFGFSAFLSFVFYRKPGIVRGILVALGVACLIAIPILPRLVVSWFPMRSMVAFATISAIMVTVPFDRLSSHVRWGYFALGAALVFVSATQISKCSYDEHLAYLSDISLVTRIISRIDGLVDGAPAEIPLVVETKGTEPKYSGRGSIGTSIWASWSRENYFRLLDNRFKPLEGQERDRIAKLTADRAGFPARDSVFFHDGVAVVVIGQAQK